MNHIHGPASIADIEACNEHEQPLTQSRSHIRTGGICKLACRFRDKRLTAYILFIYLNNP